MDFEFREQETFEGNNFTETKLTGEFEECTFNTCNFDKSDLSGCKFIDTEFIDCNLSNATISQTSFQNVKFINCKMLGLSFDQSNQFGFEIAFESCSLNHSSFFRLKLERCAFRNSQLRGVDFSEAVLTKILMQNCDLTDAVFDNTLMEEADLRGSENFYIDPELNYIRGAKFSLTEIAGLLRKYDLTIEPD